MQIAVLESRKMNLDVKECAEKADWHFKKINIFMKII